MEERVRDCLESGDATNNTGVVNGIWTRRRRLYGPNRDTEFFGLQSSQHLMDEFFHNHVVLVVGVSSAPAIMKCMLELFDCQQTLFNSSGVCKKTNILDSTHPCTHNMDNRTCIGVTIPNNQPERTTGGQGTLKGKKCWPWPSDLLITVFFS